MKLPVQKFLLFVGALVVCMGLMVPDVHAQLQQVGGASGGGGGAVTVADGADTAQGTTTDVAVTGDSAGTISAKLRGLNKSISLGLPVTGTFWQATQPVSFTMPPLVTSSAVIGHVICDSGCAGGNPNGQATMANSAPVVFASDQSAISVTGTFYQATQPVSLASMPSTPVTGTFWQSTQPVSFTMPSLVAGSALIGHVVSDSGSTTTVTGNVTVVQPTGSNLHVAVDSAPTTAVTGTFWPATQPVSGTVTVAQGTSLGSGSAGWITSLGQVGGVGAAVNAGVATAGSQRIVVAQDANTVAGSSSLPAGTNVIGHVICDSGCASGNPNGQATMANSAPVVIASDQSSIPVHTTGFVALLGGSSVSISGPVAIEDSNGSSILTDGLGRVEVQDAVLGNTTDNKSTATDTTAVSIVSLLKEISFTSQGTSSQNVVQINGVTPLMGNGVTGTGSQRVTIASDNTAFAVNATPPTLTKGTQGTTGYAVQSYHDAGRTRVSFTADRVTPAASDTLVTFVKNVGGTATTAQTTYTVTSGKTFRMQGLYVGMANTSTVSANIRVTVRENTGGTCTASSAAAVMLQVASSSIAANEGAYGSMAIPDGWEFPAADSLCISAVAAATTDTLTVTVVGFEY